MKFFTASAADKAYFATTLCWRCPTVYKMTDEECPHCHAANANVQFEKARVEMTCWDGEKEAEKC